MSELKPCPFCGADAEVTDHENFKIAGCSNLSMLCPNPAMTIYNDDFSYWNSRVQTETEKRLTTIATKHAARADELYEALECVCSYLSEDGLITTGLAKEIVNAQRILNKLQINTTSDSNDD